MEKWKKFENIDGYEFSSYGRCRSLSRQMWNGYGWWYSKEIILKPRPVRGYLQFTISVNGKHIPLNAHRTIAQLFIDNPRNLSEVNHKDLNKHNNHYKNLEWMSHNDNMKHARNNGAWNKRK